MRASEEPHVRRFGNVKYYGALTSAGSDRENASIWVEYRNLAAMATALAFLTTDPAARG